MVHMQEKKPINIQIGQNIRQIREDTGLTQEKLAEIVGVDFRYISFLENAKGFPSCELIEKLSNALQINVSDFFKYGESLSREELENRIIDSVKLLDNKNLKLLYEISKNLN